MAFGTSHSPVLALDSPEWEARAINDRDNPHLFDLDGVECSYKQLEAKYGNRYTEIAIPATWAEQERRLNAALDRLGADLAEIKPDAVIIMTDDQHELFSSANNPALAIYFGEKATAKRFTVGDPRAQRPDWQWMYKVEKMYGMDDHHPYPVDTELAYQLFGGLMDEGFDLAACDAVPDPTKRGFGHGIGFVMTRIMGERWIPIVPILINAYYPPNQPSSKRCYELGAGIRKALANILPGKRVAICASGGLSHFVTNEPLDRGVLDALTTGNAKYLQSVPEKLMNSGSSEIRNWLALGGALDGLKKAWEVYLPVYRTPAGTGIGLGFARWS
jgi:aromatic ring-opening dioxygenase catalytic subunit (LigB family)